MFLRDLLIFFPPKVKYPWINKVFGSSISSASNNAGQIVACTLSISFAINCKSGDQNFLNSLSINELVLIKNKEGNKDLYRVQKIDIDESDADATVDLEFSGVYVGVMLRF